MSFAIVIIGGVGMVLLFAVRDAFSPRVRFVTSILFALLVVAAIVLDAREPRDPCSNSRANPDPC